MVLMGIDQSLTSTGITIWDGEKFSWSTLSTEKTKGTKAPTIDYTRRLMQIADDVGDIIDNFGVELIAIEGMAFGSTGRTVFDLGGLSHILRAKFVEKGVDFVFIPTTILKNFKRKEKKEDKIQEAVNRVYDIPIVKNYGTKRTPNMLFDDNVVDSHALCIFIQQMAEGNLGSEFFDMVEHSRDVVFTS